MMNHIKFSGKICDNKTGGSVSEAITVISIPSQNVPVAGNALFMGYIAYVLVEKQV